MSRPPAPRGKPRPRARERGFTLVEAIFVAAMLGSAAAAILAIQPQVFQAQGVARDALVGQEIIRACGEKLLGLRRRGSYSSITTASCNGLGGIGGFAANPSLTMFDKDDGSITACTTTACRIRITIAKTSGPAATVTPVTLRLTDY